MINFGSVGAIALRLVQLTREEKTFQVTSGVTDQSFMPPNNSRNMLNIPATSHRYASVMPVALSKDTVWLLFHLVNRQTLTSSTHQDSVCRPCAAYLVWFKMLTITQE